MASGVPVLELAGIGSTRHGGRFLASSQRSHPCHPMTTRTLPHKHHIGTHAGARGRGPQGEESPAIHITKADTVLPYPIGHKKAGLLCCFPCAFSFISSSPHLKQPEVLNSHKRVFPNQLRYDLHAVSHGPPWKMQGIFLKKM